MDFIRGH